MPEWCPSLARRAEERRSWKNSGLDEARSAGGARTPARVYGVRQLSVIQRVAKAAYVSSDIAALI